MKPQKNSLFSHFFRQASSDFQVPLYLSIIFQCISYFQIISSIIKATFPDTENSLSSANFLKKIFVVTSVFGEWDVFSLETTSVVIWGIFVTYTCLQMLLLIRVLISPLLNIKSHIYYKVLSINILIHSRILFYPIHYFYLEILGFFTFNTTNVNSFFRNQIVLAVTIVLVIVNISLSLLKEIRLYQVTKNKNTYSCHSNLSNQLVLFHKILIPFILLLSRPSSASSNAIAIISILHGILLVFILYTRLPFYNYTIMRFTFFLSAIIFPFAIIGLINSIITKNDILETLLVIGTAIAGKAALVILNMQFEEILCGYISTPEKAIYYSILFKQFTSKSPGLVLTNKEFPIESIYYYSSFDPKLNEHKNLKEKKTSHLRKQEFYNAIINRILNSRTPFQKSAILILYMARIYMKKLNNASKALDLIQKAKTLRNSRPVKNSMKNFVKELQEVYLETFSSSNQKLELSKYFTYREEFASLKENMQSEIKLHLDFWQQISQDDTNVKKVVDLADQIDSVYLKIKDRWSKSSQRFTSVYPSSMLMYGLYLDVIRGLPQESRKAIQKFYKDNKNPDKKKMTSLSETSAIIIMCMERDKIGQVVDASHTVEDLFGISKEKLIGDKVNLLMPGFIAKKHDSWLARYSRNSIDHGATKQISSYAQKMNGTLMQVDIDVRLSPYLDKGVSLMGHIQQKALEEFSFIVKPEGTVAEFSPKLHGMLNKLGLDLKLLNMFEACHKFAGINAAFNLLYTPKEAEETNPEAGHLKSGTEDINMTKENQHTIQYTNNYTNMETQGDQLLLPRNKTEDHPLFNNNPEIDRFESLKQAFTISPSFKSKFNSNELKSGNGSNMQVMMSEDQAHDICDEYRACGGLNIKMKNFKDDTKPHKVQLDVSIEPYIMAGKVYKVIKVLEAQIDDRENLDNSIENRKRVTTLMDKSDLYDDQISEFASPMASFGPRSSGVSEIPEERSFRKSETKERSSNKSFVRKQVSVAIESESKIPTQKNLESKKQTNSKNDLNDLQELEIKHSVAGKSSTSGYSHMDFRLIKILHDFFGERKIRLVTRVSIYAVYLIMVGILALALINFFFTQKSLTEIDNGVKIVDLVSKRLTAAMRAWQYMLLIYARVAGLRPRSAIAWLIAANLGIQGENMQTINNELRSQLTLIGSDEIIAEVFTSKTRFYDPVTKKTLTNGNLDIFTANNILSLAAITASNYTLTDPELAAMSEPIMIINNTANDFFISSENQMSQILDGLQNIIDQNVTDLTTILLSENLALLLLSVALFFVVKVVLKSYSKTFNAIIRISNESSTERISKISKFQASLKDNIEAKSFLTNLNMYLEFFEEKKLERQLSKTKDKRQRLFSKRYSMRDLSLHVFLYLGISYLFIMIISGFFATLFIQSNNSFKSLNQVNDKLSVTSTLSYQSSLLVSNMYVSLIFQNRTDIKIRNEDPDIQLQENVQTFGNVNDGLLRTLFTAGLQEGKEDPIIESFLQDDICSYLNASMEVTCLNSTLKGTLGLLGFNLKFYKITSQYVDLFLNNKTLETTKYVAERYFNEITLDVTVLDAAYSFLTNYILDGFNNEVNHLETVNILLSVGSMLFILVATILIQQLSLRKFIDLDNTQKKIFRTLTYSVFTQNKSVGFLLKKEFGNDIEGLNKILYL